MPAVIGDETLCLRLLERHGVAVHPGLFFGFPNDGWLVVSLLPPVGLFAEAVRLLLDSLVETVTLDLGSAGG